MCFESFGYFFVLFWSCGLDTINLAVGIILDRVRFSFAIEWCGKEILAVLILEVGPTDGLEDLYAYAQPSIMGSDLGIGRSGGKVY